MARDEDLDETSADEELEEEGEREETDDEGGEDELEFGSDEPLIDGDGDEFEGAEEGDEDSPVKAPAAKRRVGVLRNIPMIEGVPKAKLDKPEFAKEVFTKLSAKFPDAKPKKYELRASFLKHELVDHSKFGMGFVVEVLSPNKVEVIFKDGLRKLVQTR
jgi:hypothetical protein